jgi:hypothetical protein
MLGAERNSGELLERLERANAMCAPMKTAGETLVAPGAQV